MDLKLQIKWTNSYKNQFTKIDIKKKYSQWNRIENKEINLHIHGQLIHYKGANNIEQGKNSLFNK